jgi:asparagine synthase (glutamine-hydrolysing)
MSLLNRLFQRTRPSRIVPPIVHAVLADRLTYLKQDALRDLCELTLRIENERREGILIEAGCALGGSAIVIAAAKSPSRPFNVYDVFGMIPPPSEQDGADVHERYETIRGGRSTGIGGGKYYGYEENLLEKVTDHFRRYSLPIEQHNIRLIKGLFHETLRVEEPVALAHIDGDWYESVKTCLERIEPHLAKGGTLVIDDYDCWSGCRKAVDEYFEMRREAFEFVRRARLHIIRK